MLYIIIKTTATSVQFESKDNCPQWCFKVKPLTVHNHLICYTKRLQSPPVFQQLLPILVILPQQCCRGQRKLTSIGRSSIVTSSMAAQDIQMIHLLVNLYCGWFVYFRRWSVITWRFFLKVHSSKNQWKQQVNCDHSSFLPCTVQPDQTLPTAQLPSLPVPHHWLLVLIFPWFETRTKIKERRVLCLHAHHWSPYFVCVCRHV